MPRARFKVGCKPACRALSRKASVRRVPQPQALLLCQPEHEVPWPLHGPVCRLVSLRPPLLACQTRVLISGSVITSGSVFPSVLCSTPSSVLVCRKQFWPALMETCEPAFRLVPEI